MQKICVGILMLCLYSTAQGYIVDGTRINRPSMLSYAKSKLQNRGIIEQGLDGLAYLKVPENYITELHRQILLPGYELPNQTQISIINQHEAKNIVNFQELGRTIEFRPLGFYTVVVDDQEFFMLAIDAPELSTLRQKYGLSANLEDHSFNIAIGVKKLTAHEEARG